MTVQARRVSSLFFTSLPLCFVGVLLFIALVYRRADLADLSLLVLSLCVALRFWAAFSSRGVEWRESITRPVVFAGERIGFAARVGNRKFLPVWMEARVLFQAPREESMAWSGEESLFSFQEAHFQWESTARRRGVALIGPATITTGDLFGFFPKEQTRGKVHEIVVYPRLVPLKALSLPRRDFFGTPGGESPVRDPVYILGTTDYHHGRPARFIHWKASARHDRLQEKVFEPTRQEKILLLVDVDRFSHAPSEEHFERALEAVASLAARFDRQGCSLGFLTNGTLKGASPHIPVSRSPALLPAILDALARVEKEPREAVTELLRRRLDIPWGTTCLYFAFDEDDATRMAKAELRRRKVPVLFFAFQALMGLRADFTADAGEDRLAGPGDAMQADAAAASGA